MNHVLLADVGIPMIFVQWPLMFCALLPVIAIEGWIVRKALRLSWRRAVVGSAKANLYSTLAGVPFAWAVMLALGFVAGLPLALVAYRWGAPADSPLSLLLSVLSSAWVGPLSTSTWPIALAATVLLVPTFFVSVKMERRSYLRSFAELDAGTVGRAVFRANLCSYGLLLVAACGWLGWSVRYGGEPPAPAMSRLRQKNPIDLAYLHDVAIPSSDAATRPELAGAVTKLEKHDNDFQSVLRAVAEGKIAVRKNLGRGTWESSINEPACSTSVHYEGRLGAASDFTQYANSDSHGLLCSFQLDEEGYVREAHLPPDDFSFDKRGRLTHWHGQHSDYWGHPDA